MKIVIDQKENILQSVADEIIRDIQTKPDLVLGLATGSTPLGIYQRLIQAYQEGRVSFQKVTSFNLDEYVGLSPSHPESYRSYMNKNLFEKTDFQIGRTYLPTEKTYRIYDQMIEDAGGIDLQLLGIGSNGHIAFNEPGSDPNSLTHIVKLKDSTIHDNSRFFSSIEEVPTESMSMGIASILKAKKIILMAFGNKKAKAVQMMLEGEITSSCPASYLRKHPNVVVYMDKEAASLIQK